MQFFIFHLASWLRTCRFSEPTFRPSGATNHWKNTVLRDFLTFSCTWIFFLVIFLSLSLFWSSFFPLSASLLFSSLTLPISASHLSIFSEVWLLNFLRQDIMSTFGHRHSLGFATHGSNLGKLVPNFGNRRALDLGICGYKISMRLFQRFGTGNS